ncbi:hypothetical protein CMI37_07010 [Candidatus Pacearchaeota archaeon]|nr:hypothetical protein [Candidatus Pacearchaeota archaeon]
MAVEAHVPVTQAEIRKFLKIETEKTSMNDILDMVADGVATAINDFIGVTMITSSYTEIYDGWTSYGDPRGNTLYVKKYPIVSITSIADDDVALTSDEYYLYLAEGRIVLKNKSFTADYQTIDIVYTAGYGADRDAVPDALKLACHKWIKAIYEGDVVNFSQQFGEGTFAQLAREKMPVDVQFILEPYKVRSF